MSKKTIFIIVAVLVVLPLLIDQAMAGITNAEIKAASKSWTPEVMGGGLVLAGVMFFMNKYNYALGSLGGTAFLYAAKAFTGSGEAALVSAAKIFLGQLMSSLNNHVILSHIDTPARILFWPVGQFAICIVPMVIGMFTDYFVIGGIMSFLVIMAFKIFNKRFGKSRFSAISYWYLPTSKRFVDIGIPPSHVRL